VRAVPDKEPRAALTNAEFRTLFAKVSTWNKFGEASDRGALNYLTPERIVSAAELVMTGVTISLSRPVDNQPRADNPTPADHHMTMLSDVDIGSGSLRFAKDYVGADYHNEGHSHVDAFCHVAYDGRLYGGAPADSVTNRGADVGAIDLLEDGLVGRGVLLDIPRSRGVDWIEPGEYVFREDLEAAERDQRVEVGPGDILLVRTGHARRLAELGPWDTSTSKCGLHPDTAPFVRERRVAALGSDGNNDAAPSPVQGVSFPVHVLTLNAMGVHLLDYLQFEELAPYCEDEMRWEFLFVAAPLRVDRGTGSPLNPIAIF
jgi:kynurenine formamidase